MLVSSVLERVERFNVRLSAVLFLQKRANFDATLLREEFAYSARETELLLAVSPITFQHSAQRSEIERYQYQRGRLGSPFQNYFLGVALQQRFRKIRPERCRFLSSINHETFQKALRLREADLTALFEAFQTDPNLVRFVFELHLHRFVARQPARTQLGKTPVRPAQS